ncbi:hypothetical protein Ddc_11845 [Ditylenchus destructor]|nr:hypothetical protein Ddc_11845 [Ditylenchus destructor]
MSQIFLPYEDLHSTLSFLTRQDLLNISTASRYFLNIVKRNFSSQPCTVLDRLFYDGKWTWMPTEKEQEEIDVSEGTLAAISTTKYIRFKRSTFHFYSSSNEYAPVDILRPISHVWANSELWIRKDRYMPCAEFVQLISSSNRLEFLGDNLFTIAPQLLQGHNEEVYITDWKYSSKHSKLPSPESVIQFLFKPSSDRRKLHFHSDNTSIQCRNILEMIEQRFMAATTPLSFQFAWTIRDEDASNQIDFKIYNARIKQTLQLRIKTYFGVLDKVRFRKIVVDFNIVEFKLALRTKVRGLVRCSTFVERVEHFDRITYQDYRTRHESESSPNKKQNKSLAKIEARTREFRVELIAKKEIAIDISKFNFNVYDEIKTTLRDEEKKDESKRKHHRLVMACKEFMWNLFIIGGKRKHVDIFSLIKTVKERNKNKETEDGSKTAKSSEEENVNNFKLLFMIYEMARIQSKVLDKMVMKWMYDQHMENRPKFKPTKSKPIYQTILVEGGGPAGEITAMELFKSGRDVILSNNRSEYTRNRIVMVNNTNLSPEIVIKLLIFLGTLYDEIFNVDCERSGAGECVWREEKAAPLLRMNTKTLEIYLNKRLTSMSQYVKERNKNSTNVAISKPTFEIFQGRAVIDIILATKNSPHFYAVLDADSHYIARKNKLTSEEKDKRVKQREEELQKILTAIYGHNIDLSSKIPRTKINIYKNGKTTLRERAELEIAGNLPTLIYAKIDAMVCAGGSNDTIRDKFLSMADEISVPQYHIAVDFVKGKNIIGKMYSGDREQASEEQVVYPTFFEYALGNASDPPELDQFVKVSLKEVSEPVQEKLKKYHNISELITKGDIDKIRNDPKTSKVDKMRLSQFKDQLVRKWGLAMIRACMIYAEGPDEDGAYTDVTTDMFNVNEFGDPGKCAKDDMLNFVAGPIGAQFFPLTLKQVKRNVEIYKLYEASLLVTAVGDAIANSHYRVGFSIDMGHEAGEKLADELKDYHNYPTLSEADLVKYIDGNMNELKDTIEFNNYNKYEISSKNKVEHQENIADIAQRTMCDLINKEVKQNRFKKDKLVEEYDYQILQHKNKPASPENPYFRIKVYTALVKGDLGRETFETYFKKVSAHEVEVTSDGKIKIGEQEYYTITKTVLAAKNL